MPLDLVRGEHVLWRGAPTPGLHFTPSDFFVVPFSLLWLAGIGGVAVAAFFEPSPKSDPMAFVMMPLFALFGLYLVFGRFLVDIYTRRRTDYILTDQRAIISSGIFRTTLRSINLAAVPEIHFREAAMLGAALHLAQGALSR